MERYSIEALDDIVKGFNIVDEDNAIVATVLIDNLEDGKDLSCHIAVSKVMKNLLERCYDYIPKEDILAEEIDSVLEFINSKVDDDLDYFDDMQFNEEPAIPALEIDFVEDKCWYRPGESVRSLFYLSSVRGDMLMLALNITGNFEELGDDSAYFDTKYPLGTFISRQVFEDFLTYVENKYKTLKDIMEAFDACKDTSLVDFVYHLFMDEFQYKYETEISLFDYLNKFEMVQDTEEVYMDIHLPKFLEDSHHSTHTKLTVSIDCREAIGVLFWVEKDNKYYVHNIDEKVIGFFMINGNNIDELKRAKIKFIDIL